MALVLRDFETGADPLRELNDLLTEMILADLTVVENRRTRLKKEKARPQEEALLERCATTLENEESLRNLEFSADDENLHGLEADVVADLDARVGPHQTDAPGDQ